MLGLSIASFTYLNSVNKEMRTNPHDIYVEDMENESSELMPDMRLIKMLMNKTIDFVTRTPQF